MKDKYLQAFMQMTEVFANTSEAERLKVGACLIKNGNPVCFGVNGTLPGWHTNHCEDEQGHTHEAVLHAEVNCLNKLRNIHETAKGGVLLVTHSPCIRCAHEIVASGIEYVYYRHNYRSDDGVKHLKEVGIVVVKLTEDT